MNVRVVLIAAVPTQWDLEGRIAGKVSLPLTAEGFDAAKKMVDSLPGPIQSVYRHAANEAADQIAKLIAHKFALRPRDNSGLEAVGMGLWEGLLPEDVRQRFPTVFPQWQSNRLGVTPPDGEPISAAIERLRTTLRRILRRQGGQTVAFVLRPVVLEIAAGILSGEPEQDIASHLHTPRTAATIEADPAKL